MNYATVHITAENMDKAALREANNFAPWVARDVVDEAAALRLMPKLRRYVESLKRDGHAYSVEIEMVEQGGIDLPVKVHVRWTRTGKAKRPKPGKVQIGVAKTTPAMATRRREEAEADLKAGMRWRSPRVPVARHMRYEGAREAGRLASRLIAMGDVPAPDCLIAEARRMMGGWLPGPALIASSIGRAVASLFQTRRWGAASNPLPASWGAPSEQDWDLAKMRYAELNYWREMEMLTGRRDVGRPGSTDGREREDEGVEMVA